MILKVFIADFSGRDLRGYEAQMSEYRLKKLAQLTNPLKVNEAAAAELLLNKAVKSLNPSAVLPLDIVCTESGKPKMRNEDIHFNLSHSGKYVVCALSDADIGVDIQIKSRCNMSVVKRFFVSDEAEYVKEASDPDSAYTEVWSMKESYIKATGAGMTDSMNAFSVLNRSIGDYCLHHCEIDGYHLSLCAEEIIPENIKLINVELP